MSKENFKREYLELFDFSEQIKSICNLKTGIEIDASVEFKNDREVHALTAMLGFDAVSVAYCLISDDVAVVAAQGEIWMVHEQSLTDWEPTPEQGQRINDAATIMGFEEMHSLDFHRTDVEIVPVDPSYFPAPDRLQ